jgi:MFS family permease
MVLGTDSRILTLAFARMADALGNSFLVIVLPLYLDSGQITLAAVAGANLFGFVLREEFLIGVVLSLFGFLNSFGQPFTGRLSDRLGVRKPFVLFGLVVFGVASAAYPFVSRYESVLAVRGLQGIGAAFTVPATVALVNEYAGADAERGGSFGVFNTFRLVGFGFGPIVAGIVVAGGLSSQTVTTYVLPVAGRFSGFDAAFGVAVLGAVVSFLLVAWLIADPATTEAAAGEDLSVAVFRDGGLDPVFVLGVATLFMATTIALFATLEAPIRGRLDEGTFLFGVQFAAVVIANVVLQVPVGRASDRHGRLPFLVAGTAVLVPAVLAQGLVTSPWAMLAARLLHGVAVALVFAPALALAGDLAGERGSGTTLSVLTMAFGLGVAIGPLASGFLYNLAGYVAPFAFGAVLALAAFVLVTTQVDPPDRSGVSQG